MMIPRSYPSEQTPGQSQMQMQMQLQSGSTDEFQLSQAYTSLPARENWNSSPIQGAHDNSLTYHESLLDCEQSNQWQSQQQPTRSSPIAIIRPHEADEVTAETDDDDDSVIDVELDAIRLQRKYGSKVVAATYQAGDTMLSKSMLRAPYLGSLSRSENYLSLPPMSLSDAFHEPPAEIGSYGSLRDSHQKGRFLDGPSSYRDSRTGQIRALNPRVRYNGVSSNSLSIGERMQQAQKLREKKQKENKKSSKDQTNTSSLSAMMDQISIDTENAPASEEKQNEFAPKQEEVPSLNEFDNPGFDRPESSVAMMSTSLTAFEYLMSSNTKNRSSATSDTLQQGIPEHLVREENFQPLARSMSDPTPHLRSQSFSGRATQPSTIQRSTGPIMPNGWSNYGPTNEVTMYGAVGGDPNGISTKQDDAILQYGYPAADHNPDTDGAFDMDE